MRTGTPRVERCTISAVFGSEDEVRETLYRLELLGTPRDLVEVLVSQAVSDRLFGGRARKVGSNAVPMLGVGALVGLIVGIVVSLVVVALPGQDLPAYASWAQLVGPNAGTALGALIGGAIGAFSARRPHDVAARALAADGPVVAVRHWPVDDAPRIETALREAGGRDVRVETGRAESGGPTG